MTKYDNLDARSQLEQTITGDLRLALEKRGFHVTREYSSLWVRKDAKYAKKSCYIAVVKDEERPRTWGLVHLSLLGEEWTDEEVEAFTKPFWQYVDNIVIELVGKKRFKVET